MVTLRKPSGSEAELEVTDAGVAFTPDVAGTYVAQVPPGTGETIHEPMPLTLFVCRRGSDASRCESNGCHERAVAACVAELRGSKAGQTCGRRVCRGCAVTVDGKALCGVHARIARAR